MAEIVTADAVRRLVERYPQFGSAAVTEVLDQASHTITRVLGRADMAAAEDLAQLRLDIRTRRYA